MGNRLRCESRRFFRDFLIFSFFFLQVIPVSAFEKEVLFQENSIIPLMEKWENIENLCRFKYSEDQYQEIKETLSKKHELLRVASFNILFNRYDRQLQKEHRWPMRRPRVLSALQGLNADILALQEMDPGQAKDLLPSLLSEYGFFVKDNKDGELNGVLYKKDRFELIEGRIWYMTSTPELVSRETLTLAHLKDRYTGKELAVFNAHLAFGNIEKRHFQAKYVAAVIKPYAKKMATLFMGDLNTFPHRLDLEKLPFYDGDYLQKLLSRQTLLKEARDEAILGHIGPLSTYSNEDEESIPFKGTGTPGVFLDHIFVSRHVKVILHAVEPVTIGGHFPSDHMPVVADFLIEDPKIESKVP
jgi:endonuclease/exonuclease/phosphatase family metal-dependent hydrolase